MPVDFAEKVTSEPGIDEADSSAAHFFSQSDETSAGEGDIGPPSVDRDNGSLRRAIANSDTGNANPTRQQKNGNGVNRSQRHESFPVPSETPKEVPTEECGTRR